MLNRIIIMGRMVRNPELRKTTSGKSVTSFSLAVERDTSNSDGKKLVDFIDVTAWNGTAEFVCKYFQKGALMAVDGRLEIAEWNDKQGNKRRTAQVLASNIYFGGSKRKDSSKSNGVGNDEFQQVFSEEYEEYPEVDGDLPF